jgi:hypothetical protein
VLTSPRTSVSVSTSDLEIIIDLIFMKNLLQIPIHFVRSALLQITEVVVQQLTIIDLFKSFRELSTLVCFNYYLSSLYIHPPYFLVISYQGRPFPK